ncbi:MAG: DnaA/Hda family protein [Sphingomonadales bacterium]
MSARQLPLELPVLRSTAADDFFLSSSNRMASELIGSWPDWPGRALALVGPAASGKTHLASIWAERAGAVRLAAGDLRASSKAALTQAGAVLLEDLDRDCPEEAVLHLFNWLQEQKASLLMTSRVAPVRWQVELRDLASRLRTLTVVEIRAPDDELLVAVIAKQLADRQIRVADAVIRFLVARMERSFEAARRLVKELDALSLAEKRPITIPLAREMLQRLSF